MPNLLKFSAVSLTLIALLALATGYGSNTSELLDKKPISPDMPYGYQSVSVLGEEIAYVEAGSGEPILFIHGNPTSSYLWRNIMPYAESHGHVIALDLIGMGQSSKPDLAYEFQDHAEHLEGFINALTLTNITLVVHDWGSALGMDFARRNPDRVKRMVFMEAIFPPALPATDFKSLGRTGGMFKRIKTPSVGEKMILENNFFVEKVLGKRGVMRKMTRQELDIYRAPFLTRESRKPTLVWPRQMPIANEPAHIAEIIRLNGEWLYESDIPKLYFYVEPGALNSTRVAEHLLKNAQNIEVHFLGPGRHFVQEDYPHEIGTELSRWLELQP